MLSYAFKVLTEQGYQSVAAESFDNAADLCAAILVRGVTAQIKRGLSKTYQPREEALSALRGKIDLTRSVKDRSLINHRLVCAYDEFSADSYLNRILKTTMAQLLGGNIRQERKMQLRRLLIFFSDVGTLEANNIRWHLKFNRNNREYRMLVSICWLVLHGLLQSQSDGTLRLTDFLDGQPMCHLYEKFILEYYRKEHPELKVSASQIPWALDDGNDGMLPVMQSDIMLRRGDRTLIIDAKYYSRVTQVKIDTHTLHSANLYQMFTYVKNYAAVHPGSVSGLVLYAKTDEAVQPAGSYLMSGNRIAVDTLNLNADFDIIQKQLDDIAALL